MGLGTRADGGGAGGVWGAADGGGADGAWGAADVSSFAGAVGPLGGCCGGDAGAAGRLENRLNPLAAG